jgi:hypothetical protein
VIHPEADRKPPRGGPPAEPIELGANAPLRLDDANAAWIVEAGTVEVFAVPRGATGPRTHVATIPEGGLVRGAAPEDGEEGGLSLLAVGHPETWLRRLAAAEALHPARLDGWVSRLAAGLPRRAVPKGFAELAPGDEVELAEPGRAGRPR